MYIEKLIHEKELVIDIRMVGEDLDYKESIDQIDNKMTDLMKKEEELEEINLEETYMRSKEFNLHWNNILITGEYRKWRKKYHDAHWKNEILNSNKLSDLFVLNYKNEFD
ncbi:hypothetical protein RclHR1_00120006 [Rhizophagus clarus]|uniref:Uncharacterized protein n=1 Tax=Rhizophagus clarus TaxID=94130 RepID=A0A2Z6QAK4_9GLOM|nr:hypothetical protein RclHR1_00120006 [Rhizophagus clarus]GES93533.1 hypothetical protein GLOIN_2v1835445 [Rhizophagus clarus]